MEKTKKATAPAESAQEARDGLEVGMDTSGTWEAAEGAAGDRIIGPADPAELLGCQDGEGRVSNFIAEHIVVPESGLNMRMKPDSDADILAVLPCDSGVTATGLVKGPWMEVVTGRLVGWVLRDFLEAVVPNSVVYG